QRELVNLLVRHGARPAAPGEFTQRAFMNGRIDLAQAEGVIDLISASSKASHRMAMRQANGRFTIYLDNLRDRLIEFASLLELELDFSEEEVEFADRKRLRDLADELLGVLHRLAASYSTGRSLKDGVPVVIAGVPNAGKSTLLNQLLEEEKAIVSDIPGTTRDIIEDTCEVNGILFRFIDTAGLRDTADLVERMGIERAEDRLARASIILWLLDMTGDTDNQLKEILNRVGELPDASHLLVCNKVDLANNCESEKYSPAEAGQGESLYGAAAAAESLCGADAAAESLFGKETAHLFDACMSISASEGYGIDELKEIMTSLACKEYNPDTDIILTNGRHYAAILQGAEALSRARAALDTGLSADFIAQDVRETLHHLATLTGSISTPDLLASIFSRFCIGK
ncbi:MAG: tRNA modification GTPase, partial [Muribaculaceae bacterium]|nr:tRNA modification GTPase [Muribaculaceae bacterium]